MDDIDVLNFLRTKYDIIKAMEVASSLEKAAIFLEKKGLLPIKLIGLGQYGVIMLAEDIKLQNQKAVKILQANEEIDMETLSNEVEISKQIQKINSNCLLKTYEHFQDDENKVIYIVMEYYPNGSLQNLMNKKNKSFTEVEVVQIIVRMLQGVIALQEQNIVHCDIKPENILLDKNNQVIIADFGFCQKLQQGEPEKNFRGITLSYCAPEQLSEKITLKSDLFPIGIIIYELCGFENNCLINFKNGQLPYVFEDNQFYPLLKFANMLLEIDPIKRNDPKFILEELISNYPNLGLTDDLISNTKIRNEEDEKKDFGNILIDKEDSKLILSRFNQDEISLNRFHQDEMRYYFDGYSQEESSFNQDEIRQNVCYYIKEGATFNQDENCEKDFSFKNEGSGIFEGQDFESEIFEYQVSQLKPSVQDLVPEIYYCNREGYHLNKYNQGEKDCSCNNEGRDKFEEKDFIRQEKQIEMLEKQKKMQEQEKKNERFSKWNRSLILKNISSNYTEQQQKSNQDKNDEKDYPCNKKEIASFDEEGKQYFSKFSNFFLSNRNTENLNHTTVEEKDQSFWKEHNWYEERERKLNDETSKSKKNFHEKVEDTLKYQPQETFIILPLQRTEKLFQNFSLMGGTPSLNFEQDLSVQRLKCNFYQDEEVKHFHYYGEEENLFTQNDDKDIHDEGEDDG